MNAADAALRERIRAAGGSVAFEEFMRFALYDPEHGYYARRVRTVGREGDFSTSATVHPALGEAVAAWAAFHRKESRRDDGQWHLIELGGGNGEMAAQVLGTLGWWTRRGLRYHLIEVSGTLRAVQRKRLASWEPNVTWHETLSDAVKQAGGAALVFSNEFVDAFPCARWIFDENAGWRELRVVWPQHCEQAVEVVGEPVPITERASASVAAGEFTAKAQSGQTVEVHRSYRSWLCEQLAGWSRGRLLTIDYGDRLPAVYHRRLAGTLRAYCRQMRFDGSEVYARIGQQDLTADVNFTDLEQWGGELSLITAGYGTQADFLRRWLPLGGVRHDGRDPRLAYLLDPEGPGGAFKALEQTRGLP